MTTPAPTPTPRRRVACITALLIAGCTQDPAPSPALRPSRSAAPAAPAATPPPAPPPAPPAPPPMALRSDAFAEGASIPPVHARAGCGSGARNRSPALRFERVPAAARSLALIVDDPDAPDGLFTHWVVYNMAPRPELPAGVTPAVSSFQQGRNDFGDLGWGGPCPPPGAPHRYQFHLYALDVDRLDLPAPATAAALREAMQGHTVASAEYKGRYGR